MADGIARFEFTRASVDAATCPPGRAQALYRDTREPALMLRVTAAGAKAFVFEKRLGGKTVRVTIGPATMQIRAAKDRKGKPVTAGADVEAARLAGMVAQGIDPRIEKAEKMAAETEKREAARRERAKLEVSGLDAWIVYIEDRRPRWGERNYTEHLKMAAEGGAPRKRAGKPKPGEAPRVTIAGPLRSLLDRALRRIDAQAVESWLAENKARPASAALGFRLLRAFVRWCSEHPDYADIVDPDACTSKRVREHVATPGTKDDFIQREQLRAWFAEVRKLNPVPAAYLQTLLLTGASREELAGLRWEDVDFTWRSLRVRDKEEGQRVIPLTPHVAGLLADLKNRNETPPPQWRILRGRRVANDLEGWAPSPWVFFSKTSASGRLVEPRIAHNQALQAAGLPECSIHGLRRSFASLAEWTEMPAGVTAQIMGHKPSALAERHYKRRPLDLLRSWHDKFEAWVLTEAGIEAPKAATAAAPALAAVA